MEVRALSKCTCHLPFSTHTQRHSQLGKGLSTPTPLSSVTRKPTSGRHMQESINSLIGERRNLLLSSIASCGGGCSGVSYRGRVLESTTLPLKLLFSQMRKACAQTDMLLILLYIKSLATPATFYSSLYTFIWDSTSVIVICLMMTRQRRVISYKLIYLFIYYLSSWRNQGNPIAILPLAAEIGKGAVEKQRVRSVTSVFPEQLFQATRL